MHELYITECIIRTATKALPPDAQTDDVHTIFVRVGKLDAVVPESLMFLFDAIKASFLMPNASLQIEIDDVRCRCNSCQEEFSPQTPVFLCPTCGSGNTQVLSGRGIVLERMTIRERELDEHSCCS
jgi:hydrogenase nickel incorporation protein HypA/HybF